MKTVDTNGVGDVDVLVVGRRTIPEVGATEVLVRVFAAGVNGPDLVQRRGHYPPPKGASDLLGLEVSGEITALGGAVEGWSVGDRVCALTNGGGYAEFVAVDAGHCLPIPQIVSDVDAGGCAKPTSPYGATFSSCARSPWAAFCWSMAAREASGRRQFN